VAWPAQVQRARCQRHAGIGRRRAPARGHCPAPACSRCVFKKVCETAIVSRRSSRRPRAHVRLPAHDPKNYGLFGSVVRPNRMPRAAARLLTVPRLPSWSCPSAGSVFSQRFAARANERNRRRQRETSPRPADARQRGIASGTGLVLHS
jgi:hypothetical protein